LAYPDQPALVSLISCGASPSGWLSQPRTTTATPCPCRSRGLGHPQVTSHRRSVRRYPLRHFLFLTGWLRCRLYGRVVPFAHTTGCGQSHRPAGLALSAMTGIQTISLHHRRPRCLVLWLLVLELQPAFRFMLLFPQAFRLKVRSCVTHLA